MNMCTKSLIIVVCNHLCRILQVVLILSLSALNVDAADIPIVKSGEPNATIQIGANATDQERFAASEIQKYIEKFTGTTLEVLTNQQSTDTQTVIVLGTLNTNPTLRSIQADIDLGLSDELGDEGYLIKSIEYGREILIIVTGHTSRAVIYGTYSFIESCITSLTGLNPVHPNTAVVETPSLFIPFLDVTSRPYYPIRAVLETDDPD